MVKKDLSNQKIFSQFDKSKSDREAIPALGTSEDSQGRNTVEKIDLLREKVWNLQWRRTSQEAHTGCLSGPIARWVPLSAYTYQSASYSLLLRAEHVYTSRLYKHGHRWLVPGDSGHQGAQFCWLLPSGGSPLHLLERLWTNRRFYAWRCVSLTVPHSAKGWAVVGFLHGRGGGGRREKNELCREKLADIMYTGFSWSNSCCLLSLLQLAHVTTSSNLSLGISGSHFLFVWSGWKSFVCYLKSV